MVQYYRAWIVFQESGKKRGIWSFSLFPFAQQRHIWSWRDTLLLHLMYRSCSTLWANNQRHHHIKWHRCNLSWRNLQSHCFLILAAALDAVFPASSSLHSGPSESKSKPGLSVYRLFMVLQEHLYFLISIEPNHQISACLCKWSLTFNLNGIVYLKPHYIIWAIWSCFIDKMKVK